MNVGIFYHPRPHRGASPYPWIELEPGDTFRVLAMKPRAARNSLRACAWQFARSVDWRPKFRIIQDRNSFVVERVE